MKQLDLVMDLIYLKAEQVKIYAYMNKHCDHGFPCYADVYKGWVMYAHELRREIDSIQSQFDKEIEE